MALFFVTCQESRTQKEACYANLFARAAFLLGSWCAQHQVRVCEAKSDLILDGRDGVRETDMR